MSNDKKIAHGSQVKLHIKLSLDNGFVVEDTFTNEPLSFQIGDGTLEAALEEKLLGLSESSHKTFHFAADDIFPGHDASLLQRVPLSDFKQLDASSLQKGTILDFTTPSGELTPGMIVEKDDDFMTVDFNHPLSGKDFDLEVEVISVS